MKWVQFSAPVQLHGYTSPITIFSGEAILADGILRIGVDRFPLNGGLVGHYRI